MAPAALSVRPVLVAAGLVLAIGILVMALEIILLLFTGVVVGVFLAQASDTVSARLPASRLVALIAILVLMAIGVGLFVLIAGPPIVEQFQALVEKLPQYVNVARERLAESWLGADTLKAIEKTLSEATDESGNGTALPYGLDVAQGVLGIFSNTLGAVTGIVVVMAIALYIAVEPGLYQNGLLALVPEARRGDARVLLDRLGYVLGWWFAGQCISMLILGTLMSAGLWLLGIPFALIFGLFTALMTFIPNLGPVIAAIPVLIVSLTQGLEATAYVLVLIVVIQTVEGLLLTPFVHRRIIALPPALVLATLAVLGSFAGFIGVLVAMPLTAIGQTTARFLIERRDGRTGQADDQAEA